MINDPQQKNPLLRIEHSTKSWTGDSYLMKNVIVIVMQVMYDESESTSDSIQSQLSWAHILNTPNPFFDPRLTSTVGCSRALNANARPTALRVSVGLMIPSSHSRAVE
jgi:hypothetical protein